MTDPAPDPRLRARRVALVILIASFFGILGGVSMFAEKVEGFFFTSQAKWLPAPTELFLGLGRSVRHPVGVVLCTLVAVGASVLVLRGTVDGKLKALMIAVVIATVLFNGLFAVVIYLPVIRIQQGTGGKWR